MWSNITVGLGKKEITPIFKIQSARPNRLELFNMNNIDRLIDSLKQQAELFLLDAREFFPFGTYINKKGDIVPVGAYPGGEQPLSIEVINLLEKGMEDHMQNNNCLIAGIAIDVTAKENGEVYDAIEMRFYQPGMPVYKRYFKYEIKEDSVNFWPC